MTTATKMKLTLPTDREVVMTRDFDAPRQLVFDAWTKPEMIKNWLDAPGRTMQICEIDLRVGGKYRFVWQGPGKPNVGMYGVYREVVSPEHFVRTESWEDWDAGETLVTTSLADRDGQTALTVTILFPSKDIRDQILKAGIEHGANHNFDKLAEYLAKAA